MSGQVRQAGKAIAEVYPFEILERVGIVVYQLALQLSLSGVLAMFHISMFRKYTPDSCSGLGRACY